MPCLILLKLIVGGGGQNLTFCYDSFKLILFKEIRFCENPVAIQFWFSGHENR